MNALTNLEEAANIASEFVLSLDNMPHEVQFLMNEIRLRDTRCQEIQQEINKETARYLKHSLAGKSTTKDLNVHNKVSADYTTLSELSEEKVALSQRLVTIISRARQRLNVDLGKVLVLQGDLDSSQLATYSSIDPPATPPAGSLTSGLENMKIAIAPEPVFSQTVSTAPTYKRRKLTNATSVKLASPGPSVVPPGRGRAAVQARASPAAARGRRGNVPADMDDDAEGDDDLGDAEGEDTNEQDDGIYCFCQQKSFGEMIACENEECPYQWFHLDCVGLSVAPKGEWWCSTCAPKFANPARKRGRK